MELTLEQVQKSKCQQEDEEEEGEVKFLLISIACPSTVPRKEYKT
jgi:hypothetical protein